MARINIEDCWWTDPRRIKLNALTDDRGDGIALRMWRAAQTYWGRGKAKMPLHVFQKLEGHEALLQVELARVIAEEVYVRGSSEHHDWLIEKKKSASAGGKISAKRARDARGRLLPSNPSDIQDPSKPIDKSSTNTQRSSKGGQNAVQRASSDIQDPSKQTPSSVQADSSTHPGGAWTKHPSKHQAASSIVQRSSSSSSLGDSSKKRTHSKVYEHPAAALDRRMSVSVEVSEEFRDMVNQAFENKVPPRIRNRIQDLASQFETAENFETHLNEILHQDKARPGEPKRLSFIEGCLLRQLEVI